MKARKRAPRHGALLFGMLAALCLVPAPRVADAQTDMIRQTPGSRIQVTHCDAHQQARGYAGHPWIDPYGVYHSATPFPYEDGFLSVTYVNHAAQPATEVDFGLVARMAYRGRAR